MALALAPAVQAPNLAALILALICFGAGCGAVDVAMNTVGVELERRTGRPRFRGCTAAG